RGAPGSQFVEHERLRCFGLPGVRVASRNIVVDVQPDLAPKPADRLAEQAAAATGVEALVLRVVGPPAFGGSGIDVADHLVAPCVQRGAGGRVEGALNIPGVAHDVLVDIEIRNGGRDLRAGGGRNFSGRVVV